MATSILKDNEWLSRKRANYGRGRLIGQAGFRQGNGPPETACVKPAHSHNARVLKPGTASACVPGPAGDGGDRPEYLTSIGRLSRSEYPSPQPSPHPMGRERPDHLTCLVPLNFQAKTDPSLRPSPLQKGRGGIVGSPLGSQGSWRGTIHTAKTLPLIWNRLGCRIRLYGGRCVSDR